MLGCKGKVRPHVLPLPISCGPRLKLPCMALAPISPPVCSDEHYVLMGYSDQFSGFWPMCLHCAWEVSEGPQQPGHSRGCGGPHLWNDLRLLFILYGEG
jgi:hypothetical protein